MLRDDLPRRVGFSACRVWVYRDPDGQLVGFGSLEVSTYYAQYADGRPHPYIPLLATNPTIKSLGYGTSILRHLVGESVLLAAVGYSDILLLDVYLMSEKAIGLYGVEGFIVVTPEPVPDPQEGGKLYQVMAKRVAVSPG